MTDNPTACLLIIGNEVLSGRTRDANLQFLATRLGELGIPVREVRVIPDVPETIISVVNEVRAKFTHVFTTGGIGPTHDDITSECVARAFGVAWEVHEETRARWPPTMPGAARRSNSTRRGCAWRPCRAAPRRSAPPRRPRRASAWATSMSWPACRASCGPCSRRWRRASSAAGRSSPIPSMPTTVYEGQIAAGLSAIQARHPALDLGSYPYYRGTGGGVALVAKGTEAAEVAAAAEAMFALLAGFGAAQQGEPAPEG